MQPWPTQLARLASESARIAVSTAHLPPSQTLSQLCEFLLRHDAYVSVGMLINWRPLFVSGLLDRNRQRFTIGNRDWIRWDIPFRMC